MTSGYSQSHQTSNKTVVISGILENGNIDTLFLVRDHPADRIKIPVGKEGSFHQEIDFDYPTFVSLQISRFFKYPIYAEPGDSIFIRIKNGGMTNELPVFDRDGKDRNNLILGIEYLQDSLRNEALGDRNTDFRTYVNGLPYK